MDEKQKKFCDRLRTERKSRNLTQEQAAEIFDISAKWLQRVERGQSKPGFDLICDLAKEFKINFAEFSDKEEKTS